MNRDMAKFALGFVLDLDDIVITDELLNVIAVEGAGTHILQNIVRRTNPPEFETFTAIGRIRVARGIYTKLMNGYPIPSRAYKDE